MWRLSLVVLLVGTAAAAEPVGANIEQPRRDPTGVVPVRRSPRPAPVVDPDPDRASGIVVDDEPARAGRAWWIPRALLFVPRIVLWGALQPIRGAAYLYERDGAGAHRFDPGFDGDVKLGGYPVARYESQLGGTLGARLLLKNLLGRGERLRFDAEGGGEVTYGLGARATTGHRFGPVRLALASSLELRPHDLFQGIGNTDGAAATRFEQEVVRHASEVEVAATDDVDLRVTAAWTRRALAMGDVTSVYVGTAASYDTRRAASPYPTQTLDAAGWLVRGYAGVARGTGDDPTGYVAYGGDVAHHLRLGTDTRMLAVRLSLDAVAGTDGRTDGRISFAELPALGGSELLRGYPSGRFRDRIAVVSSVEYAWRLINNASADLFVDAGKPIAAFRRADEGPIRLGAGAGLNLHTKHTFVGRAQIAASRDGDVVVSLVFQPTVGRRDRRERH